MLCFELNLKHSNLNIGICYATFTPGSEMLVQMTTSSKKSKLTYAIGRYRLPCLKLSHSLVAMQVSKSFFGLYYKQLNANLKVNQLKVDQGNSFDSDVNEEKNEGELNFCGSFTRIT